MSDTPQVDFPFGIRDGIDPDEAHLFGTAARPGTTYAGNPTPPIEVGHTETCNNCGAEINFERHPGDWPNHPDGVRVKIECPVCGFMQYTDGQVEVDYVAAQSAELFREISAEMARRLGSPVTQVASSDVGSSAEQAQGPADA